jgi:hypothetical protein
VIKIGPQAATGLVAFFTVKEGEFTHLSQPLDLAKLREVKGAEHWEATAQGRLRMAVWLGRNEVRVVYVVGKYQKIDHEIHKTHEKRWITQVW